SGRAPRRVTLNAAPINIAAGLKQHLFDKARSVIMTSATLCTGNGGQASAPGVQATQKAPPSCGTGVPHVQNNEVAEVRKGAYLPHWIKSGGVYAVTLRL